MYRIGIDIGGTNIAAGLIEDDCNIVERICVSFPKTNATDTVELLNVLCDELCKAHSIKKSDVQCIGICVPGSVDCGRGMVIDAYNLNFHNVELKSMAENAIGIPVILRNDADAAVLAEHLYGALRGVRNAVLITIGTGIGGGIIIDNHPFHGGMHNGVELGHIQMDVHGELCTCGRKGCIETLCSALWLNRMAARLSSQGNTAIMKAVAKNHSAVDAKLLIECAMGGDAECAKVWHEYIDNLADALASIINLLDPEVIAIGGGVSGAGVALIQPLNRLAQERCFFRNAASVVLARFGTDAGIIGAAVAEN